MINLIGTVVEEPKQLVESGQALKLNQADAALLMKALNRPAVANAKLKAAASRYQDKTQ